MTSVIVRPYPRPRRDRNHSEAILYELAYELARAVKPIRRGLARSDHGDRPRIHEIPPALVIDQLDRMCRVTQFLGILAGAVHTHTEAIDMRFAKSLLDCKIACNIDPAAKVSQGTDVIRKRSNWRADLSRPTVTPARKWVRTHNQ